VAISGLGGPTGTDGLAELAPGPEEAIAASVVELPAAAGAVGDDDVLPPRRSKRRVMHALALGWVVLLLLAAVLAPLLPLRDPNVGGLAVSATPSTDALLGSDQLGRDILSRVVFGARTSLFISGVAVLISMTIGVLIGLFAGYVRGKLDIASTAIADVVLAFPGLLLLIVVSALAGASVRNLILSIAFLKFPTFLRLARGNSMTFSQREFVRAARGLGAREARVALREVLPNVLPSVAAYAFAVLGQIFVLEGSLSFLGLGIPPPTPSWGGMIAAGRPFLQIAPHVVLVPAAVLFLTVLSFNALADARRHDRRPSQLTG
jgi:peptide/nickel transport system permease protein